MTEALPVWSRDLQHLVAQYPEGISEFELLARLDADPNNAFHKGDLRDSLNLFQTHFLLFHALYRLQVALVEEGAAYLEISALCIRLHPLRESERQSLSAHDPLRDYYLDLGNLDETQQADVDEMLGNFWQRYLLQDHRLEYLAVLELDEGASNSDIRSQYRRMAMQHHPDRGGDTETLQKINEAYAALMGK